MRVPLERGCQRGVPTLKDVILTLLILTIVKTIADRYTHVVYHNKH